MTSFSEKYNREEDKKTLNPEQVSAVEKSLNGKMSIITGGAGTGKTTIIKEIAKRLECFYLCAPTGKAAARLREASGLDSSTIHKMLGYNGVTFMVKSLAGNNIIIDEASMIDSQLMAEIIKRHPAKLILVGDAAQLPPVGVGSPFHDLVKIRPDIVSDLKYCYRNKEAIFHAANQIRNGVMPQKSEKSDAELWEMRQTGTPENTQKILCDWILSGAFDFEKDIIICPKNGEKAKNGENELIPGTVHGLNKAIMDIVNPHTEGEKWRVNDRIMCLKNFADSDVWNGTTGTIAAIDSDGCAWVKTDVPVMDSLTGCYIDRVKFTKEILSNCQHAYALTVHKAQGSQYRNVIFCCFARDSYMMLNRSLVYTAVTRAQKACIVVGDTRSFYSAINVQGERRTVLKELKKQEKAA